MAVVSGSFVKRGAGLTDLSLSILRAEVKGQIIAPEDADYDAVRCGLSREVVRRPALIVRPADASDVSRVVFLARETGMELAIRSGGHSLTGYSTSDGGIVLDLSLMKGVEIDVAGRTAWAEAGLTAGEYTVAAAEHGLATGFGNTASVGLGGLATGGGIGYLVRKYGLTIDNLLAAEIVTADGQIRYVDAESHPDLFWAIRGGGGNFGVVTRFKFRLHEVGTIVGGMLILPATAKVIAAFAAEATAFAHRSSRIMASFIVQFENRDEVAVHEAWVSNAIADMDQGDGAVYVNFADEGRACVHAYPSGTWQRLAAIKADYDATNLFHLNHNIPPQAR